MIGSRWALVAMGIPAIAVLIGVPIISGSTYTVWGAPVVFVWLFAWLPLTTLCLWVSWHCFERKSYQELEGEDK